MSGRLLIVDDEPNAIKVLSAILREANYRVLEARDVDSAIKLMDTTEIDAIITDVKMPEKDGFHLFDYMAKSKSEIPVIFLTAYGSIDAAVHTMVKGAYYYFIKPPDYEKLKLVLTNAVESSNLKRELASMKNLVMPGEQTKSITGDSSSILAINKTINTVKDSESSILICGETGTGKELIARSLHFNGNRRDKPFVAVNCAALPRELIESELFGYEKGAFTGASGRRIGKIEEASGGTLFLDEIGELELSLQAKLLRVLQEKEIERLGSNKRIPIDFRLVCSTNRTLSSEVSNGNFREDLYYRINVVCIDVSPLRERADDIPILADEFVREFCAREEKLITISDEANEILKAYHWPGNVRQLRNIIERAVVFSQGRQITGKDLPEELSQVKASRPGRKSLKSLREIEAETVKAVLDQCKGNKSKAAKILGISRKTLYTKINLPSNL
jgi:two-component system response regulator HydG